MKSLGTVVYLNLATAIVAGLAIWAPQAAQAQTTSSDVRGQVATAEGAPIEGAQVELLHTPSGTRTVVRTTANGRFFTSGLRVGGPYTVTVTADDFQGQQLDNIFLQPGSQDPLRFTLATASIELDAIQVTGQAMPEAVVLNNGVGSTYTARDIENQPAIDRDVIKTLLRDPLAQSTGVGNLSVGGVNPRFNGFSIDGSLQQDDFGLTTGTYATSRSPINLDIIESATLVASDYSVTAQGFTGGLVNVVTKSGGNELDGGVYYAYKDDSMVGDEIDGQSFDPGNFEEEEYGVWVSGPIIKDRLFFLASYDKYENAAPVDFTNFDATNGVEPGFFDAVRSTIQSTYGYDPLSRPLVANVPETSERIYLKLDWNITDFQRLAFSYQDSQEDDTSVGGDEFESSWYDIPLEIQAYNVEWFSDWNAYLSTNLRLNYKENTRGQICRGGPDVGQITIDIQDLADIAGSPWEGLLTEPGEFIAGCDRFRHANTFEDERLQLFGSAEWFLGDHVLTFGLEYEQYDLDNLFVASSRGNYTFETYDQLVGQEANVFYSNVTTNNALDGAATWGYDKWTAFIGDRWSITPDLELTFGVRYERYEQSDRPAFSQAFNDLYGVDTSSNLDGKDLFLPRVGFLWTPFSGASLSGGFGLFAGGNPQVWVSYAFQAPVVGASGDFSGISLTCIPQELLDEVASGPPLPLDYIAEDFEIPSDWKASLRWQQDIYGYRFTAQYLYTKARDGFGWQLVPHLLDGDALPTGTAPDGRTIYADLQDLRIANLTRLNNIDGAESHVFSVALGKVYDNGLSFDVSYAYTDAEVVSEGTSSRGISNWRGQYTVDQNFPDPRTSPFQIEHSWKFNFAYEAQWWSDNTTRFDVFGRIFRGDTWGTTFDVSSSNALFGRAGLGESPFDNRPLYIPNPGNDPLVVYGSGFDVDGFFDYLADNGIPTGGIHAPYSSEVDSWNSIWDFRFQQELGGFGQDSFLGRNKFKLIFDIENVLNLLNDEWGRVRSGPGFGQNRIVQADLITAADLAANGVDGASALRGDDPRTNCLQATDCVYRYRDFDADPVEFTNRPASVYELRLTLRYDF